MKQGDKFNRLTAVRFIEKRERGRQYWLFRCKCGKDKVIMADYVKNGRSKSCGCLQKEWAKINGKNKKTHGMSGSKTYFAWRNMLNRCFNKKIPKYKNYGKRGIRVCDRWLKFENFYEDIGNITAEKTLDRIDVNKNYCKENCRLVSMKIQQNNRSNNHLLTYRGRTQTIAQWANKKRINYHTLLWRLKSGWSISKALNFK